MVKLMRKKKPVGQPPPVPPPKQGNGSHPNQLIEAVSPYDELPLTKTNNASFRFHKSFAMIRRKHSTQRDELAKLKAQEILKSVEAIDSDRIGSSPTIRERPMTGLLPTPAGTTKPAVSELLVKPIPLLHQGRQTSKLSTARSSNTSKTNHKKTSSTSRMHSTTTSSSVPRKKHLSSLLRPPSIPTRTSSDVFATAGCGPYASCAAMPHHHQVPCIISITPLDDYDDDASSEISLEDVLLYMSTSTTATSSAEHTMEATTTATSSSLDIWPTAFASATKSCMPTSVADLDSTDSSISWPSDEEDEDDDEDDEGQEDEDGEFSATEGYEQVYEEGELVVDRTSSSLQLITEMRDLACTNEEGSTHYLLKPELACGGFKFWSVGGIHIRNLDSHAGRNKADGLYAAARDEENCRDDELGDTMARV